MANTLSDLTNSTVVPLSIDQPNFLQDLTLWDLFRFDRQQRPVELDEETSWNVLSGVG
jgi:hypothetical protein